VVLDKYIFSLMTDITKEGKKGRLFNAFFKGGFDYKTKNFFSLMTNITKEGKFSLMTDITKEIKQLYNADAG